MPTNIASAIQILLQGGPKNVIESKRSMRKKGNMQEHENYLIE